MINAPKWVDVEVDGERTKQKYFGRFCVKPYLTLGERRDAQVLADKYCYGLGNEDQRILYSTLAFLAIHITETDAKWWAPNGLDLLDESPVWAIANKLYELQDPDFGKPKEPKAE